jgi:hypothetical protein
MYTEEYGMSISSALGWDANWSRPRQIFFWLHYGLSWLFALGFLYIIVAPLIGEGVGHIVDGIYSALFLKTDRFAWTNGTVIVVSLLYFAYSVTALLPAEKRWKRYGILADLATVLAVIYIHLNVYQIFLIMMPVGLWWVVHRWGGRLLIKAS